MPPAENSEKRSRLTGPGIECRRPILMLVTDRRRFRSAAENDDVAIERVVANAVAAAGAGIDLIQVREHDLEARDLLALVTRVVRETASTEARTIVNERLDVALAAGAHGVHLPASAMSSRGARGIAPRGFLIGRSVHSEAQAAAAASLSADEGGCDYLIFGSVFETTSKPSGHPVAGLDALARVCQAVAVPVLAIGGITPARLSSVAAAGAAGAAAIGLFADADPDELTTLVPQIRAAFGSR